MILTAHAAQRFQERIKPLPYEAILKALDCRAVRTAIQINAKYVRLGSGHHVVLEGDKIVTILPRDTPLWRLGTPKDMNP